jgi:hypothetical protein
MLGGLPLVRLLAGLAATSAAVEPCPAAWLGVPLQAAPLQAAPFVTSMLAGRPAAPSGTGTRGLKALRKLSALRSVPPNSALCSVLRALRSPLGPPELCSLLGPRGGAAPRGDMWTRRAVAIAGTRRTIAGTRRASAEQGQDPWHRRRRRRHRSTARCPGTIDEVVLDRVARLAVIGGSGWASGRTVLAHVEQAGQLRPRVTRIQHRSSQQAAPLRP